MTAIITKNNSVAATVPLTSDLVQGELGVNVTDKRLFTKNSGGTVVELGTNPSSISTGAITTTSTVDGRDVAADGTKLDGIEAAATADQTNAEIRTAVEAATDSNVFTDADHTKLNAIEASATADQTNAEIRTAVEAATDSNVFTDVDHVKLNGVESLADVTDTTNVVASLTAGVNITISAGGEIAAASGVDTLYTAGSGLLLTGTTFSNTAPDQTVALTQGGATTITGTYPNFTISSTDTNTTYTAGDGGLTEINFTSVLSSKLAGIEASATADQTDAEIRTAVNAALDSNVFTDADHSKLNGISSGATADQTDAQIRTAVEAALDSNVFNDFDHSKLNAIEALADVTDTTNVVASLTAGTNITISAGGVIDAEGGAGTTYTAGTGLSLVGTEFANTAPDQTVALTQGGATTITGTYPNFTISSTDTNTLYTVGDGGLSQKNFTTTLFDKLNAVEAAADVTDTTNVVAALTAGTNVAISAGGVVSATDTNTTYTVGDGGLTTNDFTDADHSKLNGIEAGATADQTNAQILAAVLAVDGTGSLIDADKVDGYHISTAATGTDANTIYFRT